MAQLRLDLDAETYQRLLDTALSERRPVPWQAEVVLRRALGLPFPARPPDRNGLDPMGAACLVSAVPHEGGSDAV